MTQTELAILQLVADGYSNKQIARALSYSSKTISAYLSVVYEKLNVTSRTHAACTALRAGWIR